MAITKELQKVVGQISIENGIDNSGATKYKKKSISCIMKGASAEEINVGLEAIKPLLARDSRLDNTLIETSSVMDI